MSTRIYGPGSKCTGLKSERKRKGPNEEIEFQFTQNLEFSGPFCEIWSAKLTNHRGNNKRDTKTSVNNIVVSSLQYCFDRPAKGQIIDIHHSQLLETNQSQWRIILYEESQSHRSKKTMNMRSKGFHRSHYILRTTKFLHEHGIRCLNRGHQQANGNVSNQHAVFGQLKCNFTANFA